MFVVFLLLFVLLLCGFGFVLFCCGCLVFVCWVALVFVVSVLFGFGVLLVLGWWLDVFVCVVFYYFYSFNCFVHYIVWVGLLCGVDWLLVVGCLWVWFGLMVSCFVFMGMCLFLVAGCLGLVRFIVITRLLILFVVCCLFWLSWVECFGGFVSAVYGCLLF